MSNAYRAICDSLNSAVSIMTKQPVLFYYIYDYEMQDVSLRALACDLAEHLFYLTPFDPNDCSCPDFPELSLHTGNADCCTEAPAELWRLANNIFNSRWDELVENRKMPTDFQEYYYDRLA